jgi:hypothetical protein
MAPSPPPDDPAARLREAVAAVTVDRCVNCRRTKTPAELAGGAEVVEWGCDGLICPACWDPEDDVEPDDRLDAFNACTRCSSPAPDEAEALLLWTPFDEGLVCPACMAPEDELRSVEDLRAGGHLADED